MLLSSVKCEVDRVWSDSVLTLATSWLWHSLVGPALHRMASKGRRYIMSLCQFRSSQVRVVCTSPPLSILFCVLSRSWLSLSVLLATFIYALVSNSCYHWCFTHTWTRQWTLSCFQLLFSYSHDTLISSVSLVLKVKCPKPCTCQTAIHPSWSCSNITLTIQ